MEQKCQTQQQNEQHHQTPPVPTTHSVTTTNAGSTSPTFTTATTNITTSKMKIGSAPSTPATITTNITPFRMNVGSISPSFATNTESIPFSSTTIPNDPSTSRTNKIKDGDMYIDHFKTRVLKQTPIKHTELKIGAGYGDVFIKDKNVIFDRTLTELILHIPMLYQLE